MQGPLPATDTTHTRLAGLHTLQGLQERPRDLHAASAADPSVHRCANQTPQLTQRCSADVGLQTLLRPSCPSPHTRRTHTHTLPSATTNTSGPAIACMHACLLALPVYCLKASSRTPIHNQTLLPHGHHRSSNTAGAEGARSITRQVESTQTHKGRKGHTTVPCASCGLHIKPVRNQTAVQAAGNLQVMSITIVISKQTAAGPGVHTLHKGETARGVACTTAQPPFDCCCQALHTFTSMQGNPGSY